MPPRPTSPSLRALRRAAYLTIEEVAADAGLSFATVYKYEQGSILEPQLKTIRGLAVALKTTPQVIEAAIDESIREGTARVIALDRRMNKTRQPRQIEGP